MTLDQKRFGERVKAARQLRGMTQEQLAEELNIALEHLKRLENGCKSPSVDLVMTIADALTVSNDFLLVGEKTDHDKEREENFEVLDGLSELSDKLSDLTKKL